MFDFIKKWFGEGKIRIDVVCDDGSTGTVKMPYIGDINTLNEDAALKLAKDFVLVEHGRKVVSAKIVGIVEY